MKFIKRQWNYFKDNIHVNIIMSYRLYTLTWLVGVALVVAIILHKITQH